MGRKGVLQKNHVNKISPQNVLIWWNFWTATINAFGRAHKINISISVYLVFFSQDFDHWRGKIDPIKKTKKKLKIPNQIKSNQNSSIFWLINWKQLPSYRCNNFVSLPEVYLALDNGRLSNILVFKSSKYLSVQIFQISLISLESFRYLILFFRIS